MSYYQGDNQPRAEVEKIGEIRTQLHGLNELTEAIHLSLRSLDRSYRRLCDPRPEPAPQNINKVTGTIPVPNTLESSIRSLRHELENLRDDANELSARFDQAL